MGLAWRYVDPDDVMRLVQVRDLLGGQSWFDLHQYRIDPPHSPLMHWSRIVDAPLAGSILLLSPLLGRANAETATAILIPWLTLAAMVFPVAWMAFRLFGRRIALVAGVLLLTPLTRGWGEGTVYCDVSGLPHLVLFAWAALAAALIVRASSLPGIAALGLLALAGLAGLGAFVAIAPQCAGSPFASLAPLVHQFWYTSVLEALIALAVLVALWRRSAGSERHFWLSYGLLGCASLAVGLLVWRSMAFTGALCVLPLAWLADRLVERVKAQRDRPQAALRQIAIGVGGFVLLLPTSVIGLA